jgi:hypothetical protein
VILLAEFCECGSLKINGRCSNKSCKLGGSTGAASVRKTAAGPDTSGRAKASKSSAPKKADPRRASKVITYNLYDIKKESEPEK